METSASSGYNIEECVRTLLDMVMARMEETVDSQLNKSNGSHAATKLDDRPIMKREHSSPCQC